MRATGLATLFAVLCAVAPGAPRACEFALSDWQVSQPPTGRESVEFVLWEQAANASPRSWRVYRQGDTVCGRLLERDRDQGPDLPFAVRAEPYAAARAALKVEDGWLVGFNRGEWGGALYWFSPDGKRQYKISDHPIVAIVQAGRSVLAAEGLAHLGLSEGSIVRVSKPAGARRWSVRTFVRLPAAPEALALWGDGTLYLVLTDSLVRVDPGGRLTALHRDAAWRMLYPNSLVLDARRAAAYIGMRQFVAEISLADGLARYRIPDASYLNRLPKGEEERIRAMRGG